MKKKFETDMYFNYNVQLLVLILQYEPVLEHTQNKLA